MFPDNNAMKWETDNRRKFGEFTNMWKLNNTFLKNQWNKKEVTWKIRKCFEKNENKNKTYWKLLDTPKVQLKDKFITVGNSLAVQWLGLSTFTAVARVQSLVGELRSRKPCSMAPSKKKRQREKFVTVSVYIKKKKKDLKSRN